MLALMYVCWRGSRSFLSAREIAVLAGFPALVATVSMFALRASPERRIGVAVMLAFAGMGLFIVETGLLLLDIGRRVESSRVLEKAEQEARAADPAFDPRSTKEFVLDHWRRGEPVYPRIYQSSRRTVSLAGAQVFPTSNLSQRLIVECYADGHFKVYRADEYGFANPPGLHHAPVDVLLVGDSFTAGECVGVDEDIASRLRRTVPSTVSLGIGGSGPLWQLANLIEFGLPLEPRRVFWLYYEGNDFGDLDAESAFPELTRYLTGSGLGMRARKAELDDQVEHLQRSQIEALAVQEQRWSADGNSAAPEIRAWFKLTRLRARLRLVREDPAEVTARVASLVRVLRRARDLVAASGGELTVVYVPDYARFAGVSPDLARDDVLRELARSGIRTLDLLPILQRHSDPLSLFPHRQHGHFNARGYALIADVLKREVARTES